MDKNNVTFAALLFSAIICCTTGQTYYRSPIQDSDLEGALADRRYIESQIMCTLNEGPCDNVGRRLRSLAPLVLRGACPQCSFLEMRQIQRTLSYVQRNYPRQWNQLIRTYAG